MKKLTISSNLEEKIFDIKRDENGEPSKITTFFPLNSTEKQEILGVIKISKDLFDFSSIFSDEISEEEWQKSKVQIRKKFHHELIDIE